MKPRCTICSHENKWRIELLRAGGASLDALASKFNVSRDSIHRHWNRHVSEEAKATFLAGPVQLERLAERAAEEGESTLDYLRIVRGSLLSQLATMAAAGDSKAVAYVCGQLTRTLEAMARISGEMGDLARSTTFNVTNNVIMAEHPAFMKLQATLLRALAPFPEARTAVIEALRGLDAENAPAATAAPANGRLIEHVPHVPA
jgi:hypothetical protein